MQIYGQSDPPEYKVENVKVPVATYWGANDYLASKEVGINTGLIICSEANFI